MNRSFRKRAARLVLTLIFPLTLVGGNDYFPTPDKEGGWRTASDRNQALELAGVDLDRLDQAFAYTQETSQHGGLLVVRHGYLVFERYFGKGHREAHPDMASIGKAYTSIACGILLNEKRDQIPEALEQKIFTPKYLPEAFPLSDPSKADIKLGQVLTMTSGIHGEGGNPGIVHGRLQKLEPAPPQTGADLDSSALHAVMWTKPGGGYSYAAPDSHVWAPAIAGQEDR